MKTEIDLRIRKLRKKLRQIENLERLHTSLSPEEQFKVSKKSGLRAELQELLSESGAFSTTALPTDETPNLDSTTEYRADTDSGEEAGYDEDDHYDDEEEEDELVESGDEEQDEGESDDEEQERLKDEPPEPKPGGTEMIYGITDEEKMLKRQKLRVASCEEGQTSDAVPAKKHKQDNKPSASSTGSELISSETVDSKHSKGSAASKGSAFRQLQKKWCRSRWTVHALLGHNDLLCTVSMSSSWLLTGSRDTTVRLWDTVAGTEVRSMGGHTGTVTAVVMVTPQQARLAVNALSLDHAVCVSEPGFGISASSDCSIKLWDLATGEMLKSMYAFSPVTKLAFTIRNDKPCLISASDGGKVELWDLEAGSPSQSLRDHTASVTGLTVEEDLVYSSSADGEIRVYQIRDTNLHTVFVSENVKLTSGSPLHWRHIRSLSAANCLIYYGDDAMNLKVVDWREGVAHKLSNHTTEFGATDSIQVSKDLDLLLSSGYDLDNGLGFINVRQLSTEKYLCSLCDETASRIVDIDCCRSTSDKNLVLMVTAGMELLLWKQCNPEQTTDSGDVSRTVRAQFVSHFSQAARHSDVESDSEAELTLDGDAAGSSDTAEDEEQDEPVSPPFHGPRATAEDEGAGRGWLSWCNIV